MNKSLPTLSDLWKTGSIYVVSLWLNSALPLLLTPLLTHYLSPSDYGVSAMWQVLLNFTIPIIGLSTHTAVNRRYFQKYADDADRNTHMRDYIASIIPILAATSFAVFLLYALAYPIIIQYLLPTSPVWIMVVPFVASITCIYNITLSYLNAEGRAKAYAVLNNGYVAINALISILFIVGLGWNWQGRIVGGVLGMIFAVAGSLIYLQRRNLLGGKIQKDLTRQALLFSLPLLPFILSYMLRSISDRIFISQIANLTEIGLFSVAVAITGIFNILGSAAAQAWTPWLYAHLVEDSTDRTRIVRITYVALAVILVLGILFAAMAPFLFRIMLGHQFQGSIKYIWWLTGAAVLQGAYAFFAPYITYVDRNKYSTYISIATLIVDLVLTVILIQFFGVMGVAAANFFAALYQFIAVFFVANYCMPMPWLSAFFRTAPALNSAENQGG